MGRPIKRQAEQHDHSILPLSPTGERGLFTFRFTFSPPLCIPFIWLLWRPTLSGLP